MVRVGGWSLACAGSPLSSTMKLLSRGMPSPVLVSFRAKYRSMADPRQGAPRPESPLPGDGTSGAAAPPRVS